jgi:hypothetical protein
MTLDRPLARPEPPRSSSPTRRTPSALALLIGAVPFALHAWSALHGYFWQDDFIITYRAARANPVDLGYLFQAYNNEHVAPGMFLLAWLITAIAPLSYPVAVLPLLAMQALAMLLFWRLLVGCFGTRPGILPPFAVFAAAPLILLPTLWWAYAVQLIPLLLAMTGALNAHVRHLRGGERRHAVYALLWTVGGLAFYEKAALIPLLLVAVTVLLVPNGERIWPALRRHAGVWFAHAVLLAGYAALYLTVTSTKVGGPEAANGAAAELARRLILDTFLPGIFGGPLGGPGGGVSWTAPALAARILVAVLALAILAGGVAVGRRRAGLAWLLLAGYLAVDVTLLALTRLPAAGTDPRYVADAVPVAALFAAFAFLGPRREGADEPQRAPNRAAVAVAVLTVAFMISATVSYLRLASTPDTDPARGYVATAAAALSRDRDIVVYDGAVPGNIMISWFIGDARPSRVIGLLPDAPRFNEPGERIYLLDQNGQPRRIERLANAVTGAPGSVKDCGYPVSDRPTAVRLSAGVFGDRLVRLEYYTADDGEGWVEVADQVIKVDFRRGAHVLYVPVSGLFDSVRLRRSTPVGAVCVTNVQVGEPVV